ncbi:anti-phage dCTP deaminase [Shimia sp. NS0008-38b]|uniref:anti-phage dCTP deaminase n=1 Tax=Shimia sp. NS0008-38b TaxID=3127653 RepID=UPI003109E556
MADPKAKSSPKTQRASDPSGQSILAEHHSNELFVAIVGPAGAGSGTAAKRIEAFFVDDYQYEAVIIKASALIRSAALNLGLEVPVEGARKSLDGITTMQDRGDDLRKGDFAGGGEDHSEVARFILRQISLERAKMQGATFNEDEGVEPDGRKRVYIIDSLRHPAEAHLLRRVYQEAFALVGIVCDPVVREKRIRENLFDRAEWGLQSTKDQVKNFLDRDEDAPEKFGQHVSDTFHEADFFVDNSAEGEEDLSITGMNDQLKRFVSLIAQDRIERPTIAETAMHHARSAQMRSACLSRQVGAALVNQDGTIVATGTNEAPRAGGGVYGEDVSQDQFEDHRCAFRESVYCSSNKEQNEIIQELIDAFPELASQTDGHSVLKKIRGTRLGGLIEFSRAVHAEMDAILSASLAGVSPKGCRLFVTTYPCHYCARHIVAAGVDEVQFIEPYPKSRATALHSDAITTESEGWLAPSIIGNQSPNTSNSVPGLASDEPHSVKKVLFRPFVGVSPRMYRRVFLKDRNYKDKVTGERVHGTPAWGGPMDSYRVSYVKLESKLGREASDE